MHEFFTEEILGQSSEYVLSTYQKLLGPIKYRELQNFLLFKISKLKANDFDFFHKLVSNTVSDTGLEQQLRFYFELFTEFGIEMT